MDWVRHLLTAEKSPLGLKKLRQSSSRVGEFVDQNKDLRVVQAALRLGKKGQYAPGMADTANSLSLFASFYFLEELLTQAPDCTLKLIGSGQGLGSSLENGIASGLAELVKRHDLPFEVLSRGSGSPRGKAAFQLTSYWPYSAPPALEEAPDVENAFKRLGRGHLIEPDVLIWRDRSKSFGRVEGGEVVLSGSKIKELFACISGKATIRSDRSQSARYEGSTVSRWRRGRPPHVAVVTLEPAPSRLGSLAWGLGDLDCVYHAALPALYKAVVKAESAIGARVSRQAGTPSEELKELIDNARLRDLSQLFDDLFGEVLGATRT